MPAARREPDAPDPLLCCAATGNASISNARSTAKNLSRTIRLSLLAPDIVEAILNGTQPATLQLSDLEAPFSIDWQDQRAAFGFTVAGDA
jgi:hypothetical protein